MSIAIVFTSIAAVLDLWRRWIPNGLILVMLATGFALQGWSSGAVGLTEGMLGLLVGAGMLLPFYLLGGMAAGDVKLMAGVGVFLGPAGTLAAVVWTLLFGAAIAVAIVLFRRHTAPGERARSAGLPYAPAIALGTLAAVLQPL